jgi:uncharacterized protein (TIRG00374 family)
LGDNARVKRSLLVAAKAAVTLALLGWLIHRADMARIVGALSRASPAWVAAAFALHGVGLLLSAVRWRMLLAAQGAEASLPFLSGSLLTGIFFNNFLPSTVGGDLMRARDTAGLAGSGTRALAVVLVERSSGIFALGFFALAAPLAGGFAAGAGARVAWASTGALLAGFAGFLLLLRPGALGRLRALLERREGAVRLQGGEPGRVLTRAEHLLSTLEAFSRRPGVLRATFVLALLLQANVIVHYACIARALGLAVPPQAFLLIVPAATVLLLLPVSINGIGAREAVFAWFLGRYGVPVAEAVAFSWIAYGLVLVQGLLGGLLYAARRRP